MLSLPNDCINIIFEFTNKKDNNNLRQVNTDLHDIAITKIKEIIYHAPITIYRNKICKKSNIKMLKDIERFPPNLEILRFKLLRKKQRKIPAADQITLNFNHLPKLQRIYMSSDVGFPVVHSDHDICKCKRKIGNLIGLGCVHCYNYNRMNIYFYRKNRIINIY